MNIHETVLLPLMIKEIFNIQISTCQVINKEHARRNMEMGAGKDLRGDQTAGKAAPNSHKQDRQITHLAPINKNISFGSLQYFASYFVLRMI